MMTGALDAASCTLAVRMFTVRGQPSPRTSSACVFRGGKERSCRVRAASAGHCRQRMNLLQRYHSWNLFLRTRHSGLFGPTHGMSLPFHQHVSLPVSGANPMYSSKSCMGRDGSSTYTARRFCVSEHSTYSV